MAISIRISAYTTIEADRDRGTLRPATLEAAQRLGVGYRADDTMALWRQRDLRAEAEDQAIGALGMPEYGWAWETADGIEAVLS